MDINLLVVNVGNSRLAAGVFVAGALQDVVRIPLSDRDGWREAISDAKQRIAALEGAQVAGACVNPASLEQVEHVIEQTTGKPVQWVGRDIDLPGKVLTDEPTKTGVDRILNVSAAYEQIRKACAVVDAGTFVTVDFCNDAGEFLGGAILPGAALCMTAMNHAAPHLPLVKPAVPEGSFGTNTEQAMRHGVYHAIRGLVQQCVEQFATDAGSWPELIATGGDADWLFGGWELVHAVAPDLTLYAIAGAYAEHHIRHKT